jgi:hypothetical protein
MTKEESDRVLNFVKEVYAEHLKRCAAEEFVDYEKWKSDPDRYRPPQCKAGL